jgi:oxygen-independent coproporphyrinogen-3 oxidase
MGETMMVGLRLIDEGVMRRPFQRRYAVDPRVYYQHQLDRLARLGLVEIDADRLRLSRRGMMLGNQVFAEFLP